MLIFSYIRKWRFFLDAKTRVHLDSGIPPNYKSRVELDPSWLTWRKIRVKNSIFKALNSI